MAAMEASLQRVRSKRVMEESDVGGGNPNRTENEEEEIRRLEAKLFGSGVDASAFGRENVGTESSSAVWAGGRNEAIEASEEQESEDDGGEVEDEEAVVGRKRRPAWTDEAETEVVVSLRAGRRLRAMRADLGERQVDGIEYAKRLRRNHMKVNPGTDWAKLPSSKAPEAPVLDGALIRSADSEDSDGDEEGRNAEGGGAVEVADEEEEEDILLTYQPLVSKTCARLPHGMLELIPLKDGNVQDPCRDRVRSVQFHPNGQLLMTGGEDKSLKFFQIDGKHNPKVQGIVLEDMPIQKAMFSSDGMKVFATGHRQWYYVYDIIAGKVERVSSIVGREEKNLETFDLSPSNDVAAFLGQDGYVMLVSQRTKQWIGNLKMNGRGTTLAFTSGGQELITSGSDGDIYHWDMRTRRCIDRAKDDGCVRAAAMAASSDGTYFATGGGTGVVNVYDRARFMSGKRSPLKALMNLTTWVDCLRFNHDSQILAMSSNVNKDALRLVHLPSLTVFSNWPTQRTPLGYIHSMDFSPGGGFFAVGNSRGRALLYRLRHYDHA